MKTEYEKHLSLFYTSLDRAAEDDSALSVSENLPSSNPSPAAAAYSGKTRCWECRAPARHKYAATYVELELDTPRTLLQK